MSELTHTLRIAKIKGENLLDLLLLRRDLGCLCSSVFVQFDHTCLEQGAEVLLSDFCGSGSALRTRRPQPDLLA